jgi:hypothetical protein
MDLYFSSAEQPIYLEALLAQGITHVAISFYEWARRHSIDDIFKIVPRGVSVIIMPGVSKKDSFDFADFSKSYLDFAERNADQCLIFDLDAPACPSKIRREVRNHLTILPNVVVFPTEDEELQQLAAEYERLGVNANLAKSLPANAMRRIPATLYGSNVLDLQTLRTGKFVATTTMAWLSPRRYGELWVYAAGKLKHYSADRLIRAVQVNRANIEALGVDPDRCAANDRDALTELAIKSMYVAAERMTERLRDRIAVVSTEMPQSDSVVISTETPDPMAELVPTRDDDERHEILPIIGMKAQLDKERVGSKPTSVRQCDSCNLSGSCPKHTPGQLCAYSIPVEIKGRADWEAAGQTLLEWQFGRAAFSTFAEQIDGGDIQPRVGQEYDRWFKMLKDVKELERIDPEGPPQGAISQALDAMGLTPGATVGVGMTRGERDDEEDEEEFYDDEEGWGEAEVIDHA